LFLTGFHNVNSSEWAQKALRKFYTFKTVHLRMLI